MHEPHALKLYSDGSAIRNPGHEGGYSVFAEYPDYLNILNRQVASGCFDETTNNRMELRAAIEAFKFARREIERLNLRHVVLITDSQYIYNNQSNVSFWKRAGWRNSQGRPLENCDLWNEFLSSRRKIRAMVEVRWEAGKTSDILKSVDRGAKKALLGIRKIDFGYKKGKISRTTVKDGGITMFKSNGQSAIIRVFNYVTKSSEEIKVSFELYSKSEVAVIGKYFAYVQGENVKKVHRHKFYWVHFNSNSLYPIIEDLKVAKNR